MIRFQRGRRVWVRSRPTDLRKGFAGLAGLVQGEMGQELLAGDLFLYVAGSAAAQGQGPGQAHRGAHEAGDLTDPAPGCGQAGARELLRDHDGTVMADRHAVYEALEKAGTRSGGQACTLCSWADRSAPIPRGIPRLRSAFAPLCGPKCPYTPGYTPTSVRFCASLRTEVPLYPGVYPDFGPLLRPFADRTAPIPRGIPRLRSAFAPLCGPNVHARPDMPPR